LYLWMIERRNGKRMEAGIPTDEWKLTTDDYLKSAEKLLKSKRTFKIHVDAKCDILDGSHRLACALFKGFKTVKVEMQHRLAHAPPWDLLWFRMHGMPDHKIAELVQLYGEIKWQVEKAQRI